MALSPSRLKHLTASLLPEPGAAAFLLAMGTLIYIPLTWSSMHSIPGNLRNYLYLLLTWANIIGFLATPYCIFHPLAAGRMSSRLATLSALAGATLLLTDRLYFNFFNAHLDLEGIDTGIQALASGEVLLTLPTSKAIAALAVLSTIGWAAFKTVSRISRGWNRRFSAICLMACMGIFLVRGSLMHQLQLMREHPLPELLPFERFSLISPRALRELWAPSASASLQEDAISEFIFRYGESRRGILSQLEAGTVAARRTPDILVIHVESLRADQLAEKHMPNLWRRARQCEASGSCLIGKKHYSSGNNTGSGMFGLLHGLSLPLYPEFKTNGESPLPLEILKALGYRIEFRYTKNMAYDGLRSLFFDLVADKITHIQKGPQLEQERELFAGYLNDRKRDVSRGSPRFDYLVTYATHHSYYFPKEHEIFTPVAPEGIHLMSGMLANQSRQADQIRNRFFNAVRFTDAEIETLLTGLSNLGHLKNTIVIVLGDHGEEFWEHGQFGHTLGLTNEQIQTVFAVLFPSQPDRSRKPGKYRYSAHHDLMPTLFEYMGLDLSKADIFSGKSLLSYDPALDFVLTGKGVVKDQTPSRYMVIGDGLKIEFTPNDPSRPEKVVLDDDRIPSASIEKRRVKQLLDLGRKLGPTLAPSAAPPKP